MKKNIFILILFLSQCTFPQFIYWEKVFAGEHTISDIDITSNEYIFACGLGVFRSTNSGSTWSWVGISYGGDYKLAIDSNDVIYIGKTGQIPGIYKSTDYGDSWNVCYSNYSAVRSMHISSENFIYVGEDDGDFLKSTDSGNSWSVSHAIGGEITAITTTSNGQIFILQGDYGPIFTSTDYGLTWTKVVTPSFWYPRSIIVDSTDYLYIGLNEDGVAVSSDYGLTWNLYDNFPLVTTSSAFGLGSNNTVYYAYNAVYKSTNNGLNWLSMGGPNWVYSIVAYSDKIFLATTDGIYRYDPSTPVYVGNNYMPLHTGNIYQYFLQDYWGGTFGYTGYDISLRTVSTDTIINNQKYYFYSGPYVSDWIRYSEEDKKIYAFWNDTDRVYMNFNKFPGDTFYQFYLPRHNYKIASVISGETSIFNQLYKYKGYYDYWTSLGTEYKHHETYAENLGVNSFHYGNREGHIEFGETYGLIMAILYDSLGNPQYYTNHYRPSININPLIIINSQNFNLNFTVGHNYNRYATPSNGGLNFIDSVILEGYYAKNDSILPQPIIICNQNSYPNYSINKTLDTLLMKDGFSFYYRIMAKDKGIIPETTYSPDSGYYKCVWDFGTGIENEEKIIADFSLSQNYPNPFNSSTVISYQLPVTSNVTLKVYDILGNEIATLVNEEQPAGEYEVEFSSHSDEGQNLSSGIYFYQLGIRGPEINSGQGIIQTKKMILLK